MNDSLSPELACDMAGFREFLDTQVTPRIASWNRSGHIPMEFFQAMGDGGWYGFSVTSDGIEKHPALREALIAEALAEVSPGVAIAALAHMDLGFMGLYLFGSEQLKQRYAPAAASGRMLMALGNTENIAGSDAAGIAAAAEKVEGGWRLNGTKAYVTNGAIARLAVITGVTDPDAQRNRRVSMFLVDLDTPGVERTKLGKRVWTPSDLTRLRFTDVFVADDHLLGLRGRGLQQVLEIFTRTRVPISALTLGTAAGAFNKALSHARKRTVFGKPIAAFQAKAFEIADLYARLEAARLMVYKACQAADSGAALKLTASMAKYLTVAVARDVTTWAADLFGAASVVFEHPIHKYPMDAWAASLGEGTQDVQKLVIFRELMKTDPR
jgi:alkylation response protein AidB-like acyl-CoA dehydrogenase